MTDLGFTGIVAPFFLKRVFGLKLATSPARHTLKVALRRLLKPLQGALEKFYPPSAACSMQSCRSCSFVQMTEAVPEEWVNRLYTDYRSGSYNRERTRYEPGYARISPHLGLPGEAARRVAALTSWLEGRLERSGSLSMLDYGGADGRFLPTLPGPKFVFEISDYPVAPGVTRIDSEAQIGQHEYVQVAHVFEHVMHPSDLVKRIAEHVAPGGYLYLEVPQELSDGAIADLQAGRGEPHLHIHEHINQYCSQSLARLLSVAGMVPVSIGREPLDYGYGTWTVVRALGRKPL